MNDQILQNLIDWVLAHVHKVDEKNDPIQIDYRTEYVTYTWPGDPNTVLASHTDVVFTRDGDDGFESRVNADIWVQFPNFSTTVLSNLASELKVPIDFAYYSKPQSVEPPRNPVGSKWPAQGANAYFVVSPSVNPGNTWSDERGLFVAVGRVAPVLGIPFNVWIKQTVTP